MHQNVLTKERESDTQKNQVSFLTETAQTIKDDAVDAAREKMGFYQQEAELSVLLQRRDFVEYFKYALAQEVSQVIGSYDQQVQAIYLFEESGNPDSETEDYSPAIDLTVHLLTRVSSASAALEAFVTSLDRVLTEVLRELPSDAVVRRTSFLNVIPVTEKDIAEGHGYAVLLSSIYARPLQVWRRE
jgi:hypothetical protein